MKYTTVWVRENADTFDDWFKTWSFDWHYSFLLAYGCAVHFDKWWDVKRFNWDGCDGLAIHCSAHFHKWWDADKFISNLGDTGCLAEYCYEHLETWWNAEDYNWDECAELLPLHCMDTIHIWRKYYNLHMI
jgi:hypothetical protein